jgi:hypothetical protein
MVTNHIEDGYFSGGVLKPEIVLGTGQTIGYIEIPRTREGESFSLWGGYGYENNNENNEFLT